VTCNVYYEITLGGFLFLSPDMILILQNEDLSKPWLEVLGTPPPSSDLFKGPKEKRLEWFAFHKKKWAFQRKQRLALRSGDTSIVVGQMPAPKMTNTGSDCFILVLNDMF